MVILTAFLMAITSFLPGQCAINVFFYIVPN